MGDEQPLACALEEQPPTERAKVRKPLGSALGSIGDPQVLGACAIGNGEGHSVPEGLEGFDPDQVERLTVRIEQHSRTRCGSVRNVNPLDCRGSQRVVPGREVDQLAGHRESEGRRAQTSGSQFDKSCRPTGGAIAKPGLGVLELRASVEDHAVSERNQVAEDGRLAAGLTVFDTDSDGIADFRDLDSDNDGLPDQTEAGPNGSSPTDTDGDGAPDFRETDSDGDGVPDGAGGGNVGSGGPIIFGNPGSPGSGNLNPNPNGGIGGAGGPDTDGDGVRNQIDLDDDNDGILDVDEGAFDNDGDGFPDPGSRDRDGDGTPDAIDLDSDNDGISDLRETVVDNGLFDVLDVRRNGAIDLSFATGANGVADIIETSVDSGSLIYSLPDTDGDGERDALDLDSDNDSIPDLVEAGGTDADGNGVIDNFTDADGKGVDDSLLAAGFDVFDTDGDGTLDFRDTDSDGDGLSDQAEAGPIGSSPTDTDGDGAPDFRETDSNGDGVPDQ